VRAEESGLRRPGRKVAVVVQPRFTHGHHARVIRPCGQVADGLGRRRPGLMGVDADAGVHLRMLLRQRDDPVG